MAVFTVPTDRANVVTEEQFKKMKPATKEQVEKMKQASARFARICRDETRNRQDR